MPGITVDDYDADNVYRTVVGTVNGSFKATATYGQTVKDFKFKWAASQWAQGKDSYLSADDSRITYTVAVQPVNDLIGDIKIGDDTTSVLEVTEGQTLAYTGGIKVDTIWEQMDTIGKGYEDYYGQIDISNMNFDFTANFTVPDGLTVDASKLAAYTTEGFNNGFNVKSVELLEDGKTIQVKFGLVTSADSIKYQELYDIVHNAGSNTNGWLYITMPGITVDAHDAVTDANNYRTVVGTVEGSFSATASLNTTVRDFAFRWKAGQWKDGKDSYTPADDTRITYTVQVKPAPTPTPTPDNPDTPDPVDPTPDNPDTPDPVDPTPTPDTPDPVNPTPDNPTPPQYIPTPSNRPVAGVTPVPEETQEILTTPTEDDPETVDIPEGEVPLATEEGDHKDPILFMILILLTMIVAIHYARKQKKVQEEIFEIRRKLHDYGYQEGEE